MMLIWWFFHQQVVAAEGGDGDAALLLLLHPVHRGGALVDLTDLVVDAGVEEGCAQSSSSCRRRMCAMMPMLRDLVQVGR